MVIPIILLTYVYFPVLQVYLFPNPPMIDMSADYFLEIPSIRAAGQIIPNVDPWEKGKYLPELQKGIAQALGTSLPGEGGTTYLFAHSFDDPWNITRYNTAFYKINQLNSGDEILVYRNGDPLKYKVTKKITVSPKEVQYIKEDQGNVLILQTCTPIGTDWNRLLVFAEPDF